jgi:hypothetical protein
MSLPLGDSRALSALAPACSPKPDGDPTFSVAGGHWNYARNRAERNGFETTRLETLLPLCDPVMLHRFAVGQAAIEGYDARLEESQ